MENTTENDLNILKGLYNGNHLNQDEKERAFTLIYLMEKEIKKRLNIKE